MAAPVDLFLSSSSALPEVEDSDLDNDTAEQILAEVYFGSEGDDGNFTNFSMEDLSSNDKLPSDDEDENDDEGSGQTRTLGSVSEDSDCSSNEQFPLLGGQDYSTEDDSDCETASDAWQVDPRDASRGTPGTPGRYYSPKTVRCRNCDETGHVARECPHPKKKRPCYLCGVMGHVAEKCPEQMCYRCLRPGHLAKACCNGGARSHDLCQRCFMAGHHASACTDLWRQYHNTLDNVSSLVRDEHENSRKFCYNCGKKGHWGHECGKKRMSFMPPTLPFVAFYSKRPSNSSSVRSSSVHQKSHKRRSDASCHSGTKDLERGYGEPLSKKRCRNESRHYSDGSYSPGERTPSGQQFHDEQREKHFHKAFERPFGSLKELIASNCRDRHTEYKSYDRRKDREHWDHRHRGALRTPTNIRHQRPAGHQSAPPRHQKNRFFSESPAVSYCWACFVSQNACNGLFPHDGTSQIQSKDIAGPAWKKWTAFTTDWFGFVKVLLLLLRFLKGCLQTGVLPH